MRILLIVLGALIALLGFACGTSGFAAYRSVDSDGYVEGKGRMATRAAAFITDTAEFESIDSDSTARAGTVKLRIKAERSDGGPIFIGIGTEEAVNNFVTSGSYELVRSLEFGPFDYTGVVQGGTRALPDPKSAVFEASTSGPGEQELTWPVRAGKWRAVVMNADGRAGVDAQVWFAVKFPYLRGFAIAGIVIGAFLLLAGALLILVQVRRRGAPPAAEEPPPETPAAV